MMMMIMMLLLNWCAQLRVIIIVITWNNIIKVLCLYIRVVKLVIIFIIVNVPNDIFSNICVMVFILKITINKHLCFLLLFISYWCYSWLYWCGEINFIIVIYRHQYIFITIIIFLTIYSYISTNTVNATIIVVFVQCFCKTVMIVVIDIISSHFSFHQSVLSTTFSTITINMFQNILFIFVALVWCGDLVICTSITFIISFT